MKTYVMTNGLQKRFQALGKTPVCQHCGKGFRVGEKVLARASNGRTRYWHQFCWEEARI